MNIAPIGKRSRFTLTEAAEYLNTSSDTVLALCRSGNISYTEAGGMWWIPKASVEEFLHDFPQQKTFDELVEIVKRVEEFHRLGSQKGVANA